MQGMGMSHEISYIAEAESVRYDEGNTNGADMRGTAALPGSNGNRRPWTLLAITDDAALQ
jgi:hypothetical protein